MNVIAQKETTAPATIFFTHYQELLETMQHLEQTLDTLSPTELGNELQKIDEKQEMISQHWFDHPTDSGAMSQSERENCHQILKNIQATNTSLRRRAMAHMASLQHERKKLAQGKQSCTTYQNTAAKVSGRIVSVSS